MRSRRRPTASFPLGGLLVEWLVLPGWSAVTARMREVPVKMAIRSPSWIVVTGRLA